MRAWYEGTLHETELSDEKYVELLKETNPHTLINTFGFIPKAVFSSTDGTFYPVRFVPFFWYRIWQKVFLGEKYIKI
jgi:hypothetical protein